MYYAIQRQAQEQSCFGTLPFSILNLYRLLVKGECTFDIL